MFTGIVQGLGRIVELGDDRLVIDPDPALAREEPWQLGESVAVNGCCLTVVEGSPHLRFDLSPETIRRTGFRALGPGQVVNLERAMRLGDRFGGHIVQGHVDTVGELVEREDLADQARFRFRVPVEGERYLIDKGSIALDGISLTIVKPEGAEFDVWVIPHTLAVTNFGPMAVGAIVNVEYDVIAKHVEKLLQCGAAWPGLQAPRPSEIS